MSGTVVEDIYAMEKPKRKMWKILVPLAILILVVSMITTAYFYTYNRLGDIVSKSFETLRLSNIRLTNINLFLPSADVIADYTIDNPTERSIRLVKVSFDIWIDGVSCGTLTATDKLLPPSDSTVLTATFHVDPQVMDIMAYPYTIRLSGEVVASINILFLTVTRACPITGTQTMSAIMLEQTKAGRAIMVQSMANSEDDQDLLVYVQNVGEGTVTFDPAGCAYVDGALVPAVITVPGAEPNLLQPDQTATILIAGHGALPGQRVRVRIVTTCGTFMEAAAYPGEAAG